MERITDAWQNLARREQVLALSAVAVLVLVVLAFLLFGGDAVDTPVDASTASVESTAGTLANHEPPPAVVGDATTSVPAPQAPLAGGGVAGLTVSGGGDGGGTIKPHGGEAPESHYPPEQIDPRRYVPPVVSTAIMAAARDLEAVTREYHECMEVATERNTDRRRCLDVLKYGVEILTNWHANGGITLTKRSSDGHRLDYTLLSNGADCRALDRGDDCDSWPAP